MRSIVFLREAFCLGSATSPFDRSTLSDERIVCLVAATLSRATLQTNELEFGYSDGVFGVRDPNFMNTTNSMFETYL